MKNPTVLFFFVAKYGNGIVFLRMQKNDIWNIFDFLAIGGALLFGEQSYRFLPAKLSFPPRKAVLCSERMTRRFLTGFYSVDYQCLTSTVKCVLSQGMNTRCLELVKCDIWNILQVRIFAVAKALMP